jgi:hypothetical protein
MYVCAFKSLYILHTRSWENFGIWHKLPPPCMDHSGASSKEGYVDSVFLKVAANFWCL